MIDLPIDPELLKKRAAIPAKIAELSYTEPDEAIKYLRIWGEKRMPVSDLFNELSSVLNRTKELESC